eukprot:COSAG02_NODE_41_length_47431_cov_32.449204_16_plen_55_part_00
MSIDEPAVEPSLAPFVALGSPIAGYENGSIAMRFGVFYVHIIFSWSHKEILHEW